MSDNKDNAWRRDMLQMLALRKKLAESSAAIENDVTGEQRMKFTGAAVRPGLLEVIDRQLGNGPDPEWWSRDVDTHPVERGPDRVGVTLADRSRGTMNDEYLKVYGGELKKRLRERAPIEREYMELLRKYQGK